MVAKDANGYSDPYCMLGIRPDTAEYKTQVGWSTLMPGHLRTIMLQTSNESSVDEVSLEDGPARLPDLPRPPTKKHSSFRSRLSFRKKDGPGSPSALRRRSTTQARGRAVGGAERRDSGGSADLPARFIQATTVKPATLCPVWNEKFEL